MIIMPGVKTIQESVPPYALREEEDNELLLLEDGSFIILEDETEAPGVVY